MTNSTRLTLGVAALALLGLTGCPGDDSMVDTEGATDTDPGTGTMGTMGTNPTPTTDPTPADTTQGPTTEGSSSTGEPTAGLLERIFAGLGGQDALDELVTAELQVTGESSFADELFNPGDPSLVVSSFASTVSLDLEEFRVRNDITREIQFIPLPMPLVITEWAVTEGGYVEGIESLFGFPTGTMLSDRWASTLKRAALLNPHVILKELSADPSPSSEVGTGDFDGQTYDLLEIEDDIFPVTLWVDQDTDLIRRLTTMENSHLHRDTTLEVEYADWEESDAGVLFPNSVQILVGGNVFHEESRKQVLGNPEFEPEVFALPPEADPMLDPVEADRGLRNHHFNQAFVGAAIPLDGLQLAVVDDELSPGVHHITGGTHHSMVIEQENGVVVFDAPLNAQRCEAILDWIDMSLGGAQVTHIVQSHHHIDHASCARVFVATGAALVVHETAETFFDDVLAAPSTIDPDRLEDMPVMDPVIEVVPMGGSFVIDDPVNPVEVYELSSTHAADLVFPFVPSAGVAFVVDVYNPGQMTLDPTGPAEVIDSFDFHMVHAAVTQVAGGHGGVVPIADLEMIVGG